jgi:hypothetical protein
MQDHHIAQFNFARLLRPIDDDANKGFRDGSEVINRLAARSAGVVWVFESTGPNGTMDQPIWNDPLISINMSVWKNLSTLEYFVYNTLHKSFLQRSENWFASGSGPNMVLWWVPQDHIPTIDEAMDRLSMLKSDGSSERAFGWEFARNTYPT